MRPAPFVCRVSLWVFLTWKTATALAVERGSRPLITPAPMLPEQLDKRDGITWAYVDGNSASPLTCPPGLTTSNSYAFGGIQACCNAVSCVDDWQTCLPYGVATCTDGLPCSDLYTSYLTCGQAEPGCVTYRSITGPNDPGGVTSYGCGATSTVLLALASPTVGNGAAASTVYSTVISTPFGASSAAATTLFSTAAAASDPFGGETGVFESSSDGATSTASKSTPIGTSTPFMSLSTSSVPLSLSSSSSASSSSVSTGSTPTTTQSASGTISSSTSTSTSSSGGLDTGSIVGIVAGAVSLIAIFVTIWLKWPKTVTRFLTCGICTTIDDDAPRVGGHHGVPLRYIPQRYEQPPRYQPPQYQYEQHHPMQYS